MSPNSLQPGVLRVDLDAALLRAAAAPLPIDLAEPDPFHPAVLGDPYPRHLFMRSLEWPEPLPPVLRPDRPYCPTAHAVQLGLLPPGCLPDAQWPRFIPADAPPFVAPTSPEPEPEPVPTWVFILGSAAIWAASAGAVGYLLHRLFS